MDPPNYDVVPSFNLWLGSPKTGGGNCNDKSKNNKSLLLQHKGDGCGFFAGSLALGKLSHSKIVCTYIK